MRQVVPKSDSRACAVAKTAGISAQVQRNGHVVYAASAVVIDGDGCLPPIHHVEGALRARGEHNVTLCRSHVAALRHKEARAQVPVAAEVASTLGSRGHGTGRCSRQHKANDTEKSPHDLSSLSEAYARVA